MKHFTLRIQDCDYLNNDLVKLVHLHAPKIGRNLSTIILRNEIFINLIY